MNVKLSRKRFLPSPRRTSHPRKSPISTKNRDCEKCFEFVLVCKTSRAPQLLETNSESLGTLVENTPGISCAQIFRNRLSSGWRFRENPTDSSDYTQALSLHQSIITEHRSTILLQKSNHERNTLQKKYLTSET